jgi:hypothetical protein
VLADLVTTLTAEPASPTVGASVVVRVTVADKPGTGGATGVITTITLPAGLTFVRAEADRGPGCSLSRGARIVCDLDWVSPDAPATGHILVGATVNAAGTHHITAATSENAGDQNPADNEGSLDLVVAGAFTPPAAVAPRAASRPTISGRAVLGAVLRASAGVWRPANPGLLRYRWQRLVRLGRGLTWRDVPGRTQRTIRLTRADVGKRLRVIVTATNEAGTGTAASRPTAPVRWR